MSTSLLEKIIADATAHAAKITQKGELAVKAIEVKTAAALKDLQENAAEVLRKAKAQQELVSTSKSKQAHKLAVQSAKRVAIDAVFAEAFTQLAAQSAEEYITQYTKIWQDAVPAGETVVAVAAPTGRETETQKILSTVGATVVPVLDAALTAGVIVTTNAGVYDLTLNRRFVDARAELEMQVVAATA